MGDCIVGVGPLPSDCLDAILNLGFIKYVDCSEDFKEASIMQG